MNERDLTTIAKTLWAEARGEPHEGQVAVAWVIVNRSRSAAYAGGLAGGDGAAERVCLAPYQFSCWLQSDPNYAKLQELEPEQYADQTKIAQGVADGDIVDPTAGADHYYAIDGGGIQPWPPAWARTMRNCGTFGTQVFFDADMPPDGTLSRGMRNDAVRHLQAALATRGFLVTPDGIFGPQTEATVRQFQRDQGITVTGAADAVTRRALGL